MINQNIKHVVWLGCLACFAAAGNTQSDTESGIALPALSRGQIHEARKQGVDISKINRVPGLHIVPLSESWSTSDHADIELRQIEQQRSRGFYSSGTDDLVDIRAAMGAVKTERSYIPRHDRAFRSLSEVSKDILVKPVDLGPSALSAATLLEVRLGGSYVRGRWTGLARSFEVPELGVVILNETDHAAGRESVSMIKEWINIDVNDQPGTSKTARSSTGRTIVTVGWANQRKLYSLQLQPLRPDAMAENEAKLQEIARQLVET